MSCAITAACIGGAAVIGSAVISSKASSNAAQEQANAASSANAEQQYQFDTTNANEAPYRAAGNQALGTLGQYLGQSSNNGTTGSMYGQFAAPFTGQQMYSDPGYQFRQQQGDQAIQSSAAGQAGLLSGGTLTNLANYNQNAASQEYSAAYSRYQQTNNQLYNQLASMAGLGQTANSVTGTLGAQAANQIGSNMIGAGNAQAAGTIGSTNAITNGIGQLNTGFQQYMAGGNNGYSTAGYSGVSVGGNDNAAIFNQENPGGLAGGYGTFGAVSS